MITLRVDGAMKPLAAERFESALRARLLEAGELVAAAARRRASGEVLRARTGALLQSIAAAVEEPLRVRVEAGVPYAALHELGARPFLRPSLEEHRERIGALLASAFQGESA